MDNYLSRENADIKRYASPICVVTLVETQRVICGSETETVGETDGEW